MAACIVGVAIAACGKKGPPLAPLVRLPAAVQDVTAVRLGHEIYVTLTIPAANVDRSTPVDLEYVDIYAYTGAAAPPRLTFVDQATRIARVPVVPVPLPGDPPAPPSEGASAGTKVTIVETVMAPSEPMAKRFYVAVPFSTRDRPGPQHAPVEVTFAPLPAPPGEVSVTYTERALSVSWTPGAEQAGAPGPKINVYAVPAEGTDATPPPWQASRPRPLNNAPLQSSPFTGPVEFGVETCYVVRAVAGEGAAAIEGEPSPRTCITPVDTFAPAAPAQLVAVATGTAISLLWEANAEPDLAGYIVLRGSVGDATLRPLFQVPTTEVRFVDMTVVSGMRYVYAVVAVDRREPMPNVSPESARVEETAQ